MLTAKGNNGTIEVDGDWLTIHRGGLRSMLSQGAKGTKRVPLGNITAVQIKEPGLSDGYIQFAMFGSAECKRGANAAAGDENTVMFKSSQRGKILEVRDLVEQAIVDRSRPTKAGSSDAVDQIRRLAELRDEGLIEPDEFERKRRELLERM